MLVENEDSSGVEGKTSIRKCEMVSRGASPKRIVKWVGKARQETSSLSIVIKDGNTVVDGLVMSFDEEHFTVFKEGVEIFYVSSSYKFEGEDIDIYSLIAKGEKGSTIFPFIPVGEYSANEQSE